MQTHDHLCTCSECRTLDRKHPREGQQLAMFEQREQRAPTEAEAAADLFRLAGLDTYRHGDQWRMTL